MEHQDWKTIVLKNPNIIAKNQPKNIVKKTDLPKSSVIQALN